jgi:hypothetical protein
MARPIAITALPPSPDDDQRRRFRQYTIAMGIRVACILACVFTSGWVQIVCIVGAVILPSIAVMIANAKGAPGGTPERPGPSALPPGPTPGPTP